MRVCAVYGTQTLARTQRQARVSNENIQKSTPLAASATPEALIRGQIKKSKSQLLFSKLAQ
jgi:hypothetical protein